MKIDFELLRQAGLQVEEAPNFAGVTIYPRNGSTGVYEDFRNTLQKVEVLDDRECDIYADKFAQEIQNAEIWAIIKEQQ